MKSWLIDKWHRFLAHLKGARKSWTIWFNGVGGLAGIVAYAATSFPDLQGYVPAGFFHYAMVVLTVGNFLLRFKTCEALADKAVQ